MNTAFASEINWLVAASLFLLFAKQINSQFTFIRSCNEQIIVDHAQRYGHTYCSHACRGADPNVIDSCGASGDCLCTPPCSDDPAVLATPAVLPSNDVCPPLSGDPGDPDPNAMSECMTRCAASCGGVGIVCGEVELFGTGLTIVAKICTCGCPAQPCTPIITTTTPDSLTISHSKKTTSFNFEN